MSLRRVKVLSYSLRSEYAIKLVTENGYCESFNVKLRDDLLNGEIF